MLVLKSRLREIRKEMNITQAKLAEMAGVRREFIALLETEDRNPSLYVSLQIASALNKKVEEKSSDIFAMFEGEFGRTLSPIEYEMINKWLESGVSEDTIKSALKEAILNNVRSFKYIDKIIYGPEDFE